MLHFLLPAYGIVVDCSYVLSVKASPPDVEMARLVARRYGGESESVPGCLFGGTGTLYRVFSDKAKTPGQCSCSGKTPVCGGHTLGMSIALGNKKPSAFFVRRDIDGP